MSGQPSWPSAVVAVAVIALVGLMFWQAVEHDFKTIWAAVGTVVGVVTGAIPAYFFKAQADKASARAEAISAEAPSSAVEAARKKVPRAFL
jgi:uncharacterized membrane protein